MTMNVPPPPLPEPKTRYIPTTQTTCPNDGSELEAVRLSPIPLPDFMGTQNRRCPKCGERFSSSALMDAVLRNSTSMTEFRMPKWLSTELPSLDDASERTTATQKAVTKFQAELEEVQKRLPERNAQLDEMRLSLAAVQEDLGKQREAVDAARAEIMQLMPDPVEFAYLRVARAEVADLRNLVTNHVDEDHKRKQQITSGKTLWLARLAIGVSVVTGVVSIAISVLALQHQ